MAEQFAEFTSDAQHAFSLAEAEARALSHNYIGQEHLLLGLFELEHGPMPALRDRLGISPEKVREGVMVLIGPGAQPLQGELGMTPRLKRAVQLAADEAKVERQSLTSSAHLLCGLLLEGTGVGAGVLQSFGVTVEQVREFIRPQPLMMRAAKEALSEWADQNRGLKRYLLTLPVDLFQEVQELAERQQTNVADLLRRFTRLGLLATRIQETPGSALIIREGDSEQRILLL